MGVTMRAYIKSRFLRQSILAFTGMPLLIWAMGNFPERSVLKELLSLMTILVFCQMMGQFFWARTNRLVTGNLRMSQVTRYHKIVGYIFIPLLFFHPVLLVVPRFFESGVAPVEAFITIVSTLNQGVVLGIIAWCLMLILGITSFARKKLSMGYKTWRFFHGILAILFMVAATWHVIDLGRHSTIAMSALIIIVSAIGVLLLLKCYALKIPTKRKTVQ